MVAAAAGIAVLAVGAGAVAQEPAAPAQGAPAAGSTQPLSAKYRFIEGYGVAEDLGRPDRLVQYQVGSIETIRSETEKPRGAPDRQEIEYRTIYTERAARLGRLGEVTDAVRRYDSFRAGGAAQALPQMAILMRGLSLWYHARAGGPAELISLTPNRPIRQLEYETALSQIFFPRLTAVFPPRPVRVADTWTITRAAAQALLGQVKTVGDFQLEATLAQVDKAPQGTAMMAMIDISGILNLEEGEGAVRARLWFLFEPTAMAAAAPSATASPSARSGAGAAASDREVVEARGYITKLNMSRRLSKPLDDAGRLQEIGTRELLLQRRRVTAGTADFVPLAVPEKPPAEEINSWLLYDDPDGRFHLRHPQELSIEVQEPDALVLQYVHPDGKSDTVIIGAVPRDADSARDRKSSDPQVFVREVQQNSARYGGELVNGEMGWLPDPVWAPLKRRVYRYEAALKRENAPRHYLDAYVVQFARGDQFRVQAMTDRDDHLVFRNQAEGVIRSLELGPSDPAMAPPSPQPARARRPAAGPAPAPDRSAAPAVPRLDRGP
jgi:hypothetical protein